VTILLLVSLVLLLGVGALALNMAWLASHQVQLRQACESAALAGAAQLLDPAPGTASSEPDPATSARVALATEQAEIYFSVNSSAVLQTTGDDPDLGGGWREDPTIPRGQFVRWTGDGPVNSFFVRGVRRKTDGQGVILWFGNFFGVASAEPAASASASMDQRIYGFRPVKFVHVPMVPLLAPSSLPWPSSATGSAAGQPDNYSVDLRTGTVSSGPDGVAEITLRVPLGSDSSPSNPSSANWLSLTGGTTTSQVLELQVAQGLDSSDLAAIGGQFALGEDGTLSVPVAPAYGSQDGAGLQAALLAIRGQRRIWPLGSLVAASDPPSCQVTGFVAGCVVDCSVEMDSLTVVIEACSIQTCTGLMRSGTARNPWIGKLILNE
jgi:hypothetical protein